MLVRGHLEQVAKQACMWSLKLSCDLQSHNESLSRPLRPLPRIMMALVN
jgi:hypothetical protein